MKNGRQEPALRGEYGSWLGELKRRYLEARQRAAVAVNTSLLEFYWSVGRDISEKQYANNYGSAFYKRLSRDLIQSLPDVKGVSPTNLKYMFRFYELYRGRIRLQPVDDLPAKQAGLTLEELCSIPWFHHQRIIDKCKGSASRAIFYVRKTLEFGWGRSSLMAFLDSDLYEREGKAITNFESTLPAAESDLIQQIIKDPYNFDFLTLKPEYDERELETALVDNVTKFLLELGTGFSFMGRQLRLEVGEKEFFPDLLFYNTKIHAYCVVEIKTGSFKPEYLGQLSFYVSAVNHQYREGPDNPTIGLLICKDKDSIVAKYALEPFKEPLGISEYQLSRLYPADFKSSMPSIEEVESAFKNSG